MVLKKIAKYGNRGIGKSTTVSNNDAANDNSTFFI